MFFGQVGCMLCLLLGICLTSYNAFGETAKRRFTVADDIRVAHFGDLYLGKADAITFSPNGRYFVVDTERGLLEQNRPESTLRIYRMEDVQQFLLHSEKALEPSPLWVLSKSTYKDGPIITHIRWLADSSGIAFLAKTAAGNDELFLADLRLKRCYPLTRENQHVTSFDIRDRMHFVYSVLSPMISQRALAESQATSIVGTGRDLFSLLFPENLYPFRARDHDLSELWAVVNGKRFRIDSESSGRPVSLYSDGQSALALSPDGRFVVTAMAVGVVPPEWEKLYPPSLPTDPGRIHAGRQDQGAWDGRTYVSEYVWIELSTGEMKSLTNAPIGNSAGWWSFLGADWSSDGKSIVLLNTFLNSNAQDAARQPARPCVALVDLLNNNVTCLERWKGKAQTKTGYEDDVHFITGAHFSPGTSRRVTVDYWKINDPNSPSDVSKGSTSYVRLDGGSWTVADKISGWIEQDRAIQIGVKESFIDPPVLVATDKTTKTSRVILNPNPQLKDVELGEASVFKWKDRTGRDWIGGLYKPPDYVSGQRYPLVVQTHGFFEFLFRPDGIFPTGFAAQELATAGILVLQVPDCPFTGNTEEGSCNVAGYEAGIEKLVAEGAVDQDLVGIVGFSRTGYYVLEALTSSAQHFRAASITDSSTEGHLQYIINVDWYHNTLEQDSEAVIGASPFGEGLQQWFKRSPDFNLDKVRTPLQVVAKGRPALLQMWEPYAALRYLNKPVDLIVLSEGTHVLTNPAERMASQGGTVDWFRFWLKGEEDPDPAKSEQYTRWRELSKLVARDQNKSPGN